MALSANILGQAMYDAEAAFNNQTADQLVATYGSIEAARLALQKAIAGAIVAHITGNAQVQPTLLVAGTTPVTGTGTIS